MTQRTVCIVGLGYVGLPLAHAFAKAGHAVLGYDISAQRIGELKAGTDRTRELSEKELKEVTISYSADPEIIGRAEIVILAIPTPVDNDNNPDLALLKNATAAVGKHLKKGMIVVYESTVYPGTTEEICGPILEKESGLKSGSGFFLGYSPERINPGDKEHTVARIVKIVAAQDAATLDTLTDLYGSVVTAGIHRAPNIRVAEMAKAIENAQRDLNIAFVNEIALLCNKIGIRTADVIDAAATKWNFLPFRPGLVGGHCIGVDPYYLVEKARQLGMLTRVIAAGRAINDEMSDYVAVQIAGHLPVPKDQAKVLILGLTFKEDIPDRRNSKAPEVAETLAAMGCTVVVHDPFVPPEEIKKDLKLTPGSLEGGPFDAVVLLVTHKEYRDLPLRTLIDAVKPGGLIYDLKSILDLREIEGNGRKYRSL